MWDTTLVLPAGLVVLAYLIGSIPFSYLVGRILGKTDIRLVGSGNVGATNVARSVGKAAGVVALLLDFLKGWAAVMLACVLIRRPDWPWPYGQESVLASQSFWIGLASLIAVLGHMAPIWLRFQGGKGVATAGGAFLAISPLATAAAAIVFLITALLTRYVSLGSIVATASMPLILRFLTGETFWIIIFSIVIAVLVILKHHRNIARIARGGERRFPG